MNAHSKPMTVEAFIDWSLLQPGGRHQLLRGEIIAMASERAAHRWVKHRAAVALERAAGPLRNCHVEPDGATVKIDVSTAFDPDALVYCGPKVGPDTIIVPDPVIVIEVLSPSTQGIDSAAKLTGYCKVPSIQHYLILDPVEREIVHHQRVADGSIRTTIHASGDLRLDPPGMTVPVAECFPPSAAV
jgi:Uma2 family endonuclease